MFDVIIIGGGVSGGSAAIYTANAELNTLVIDQDKSQIKMVSNLVNYPGIKQISGDEYIQTLQEQSRNFGAEWRIDEVSSVNKLEEGFSVQLVSGETLETKYVIVASNTSTGILSELGFEIIVNEKVPNGRVKQATNINIDGSTNIEGLYVTGHLAGISSQSVIASAHGVQTAIAIVTDIKGQSYMWHDR